MCFFWILPYNAVDWLKSVECSSKENMQNMTTRDLIEQEQKYGLLFLCRKGSMLSTWKAWRYYKRESWCVCLSPHIKIFIILIKLIFQNNIFNKICGIFLIFFGDMATFAVEVWSWKLCQIKDPLVFGGTIHRSVDQNKKICELFVYWRL